MENRLQYRYHEKLYKERTYKYFLMKYSKINLYYQVVLTLMILKAHINL
jgi:hypothetical protein